MIKAAHAILAFAVAVTLARLLGPEGYGVYSFALAILMLVAIPAQLGIPKLVVRETAKAQSREDWSLMYGLWRWGSAAVLVLSIVGVMIVCGVVLFFEGANSERNATVAIGTALIPLIALANVRAACLRGLRMVVWGQLPESILRPAILMLLVGAGILTTRAEFAPSPSEIMGWHVIAAIVTFFVGTIMLWRACPKGVRSKPSPHYESSGWRKAIIPLAMISGFQVVNSYTDLIVLGIFREHEEVGIYRAAFQLALLVIIGLQALNKVLQPHYARLYQQQDIEKLQRLVTNSSIAMFLMSLPPVIVLLFSGSAVLSFVYGGEYVVGAQALAILVVGQLLHSAVGSVAVLLNMTGHERDTMLGFAIAACANVFLNFLLIPYFGMVGAATASALTLVLWVFLLRRFAKRRIGIEALAFRFIRYRN
jgi:O-antigen/teichoic acid export membrane protein